MFALNGGVSERRQPPENDTCEVDGHNIEAGNQCRRCGCLLAVADGVVYLGS